MEVFDSFAEFVRREVLPRRVVHPDHARLDGRTAGGNWDVAGRFVHDGRVWTVHADSHYEPLLLAFEAAEAGENPFVESETNRGKRLDLALHLQARRGTRHRHLYIYVWPGADEQSEAARRRGGPSEPGM